jgi:3-deoxy-D-manno-octulosonate cytidylyltransferase
MHKILCCIPARYQSSRLPGKPLLKINNKTIIQLVYEKALQINVDKIVVLTDDERIYNEVIGFGGNCKMTGYAINGTERIVNYLKTINTNHYKAIVNIQGDEPFICPNAVNKTIQNYLNKNVACSTICFKTMDKEEILSKNRGKVIVDNFNNILYCSRNVIPSNKTEHVISNHKYNIHVGVFVYNISYLLNNYSKPNTEFQMLEDIEWLKIIEQGFKVNTIFSDKLERGIDTIEDYHYFKKKFTH